MNAQQIQPQEIQRRRERLGLSRPQLAAAVGVAHMTIWRWENGTGRLIPVTERALRDTLSRLEAQQQARHQEWSQARQEATG